MKNVLTLLAAVVIPLIFGCSSPAEKTENRTPNILFVISDDQSYYHTSFAGSAFVNTPAFDRIAREGVYFTNCIAGSPGCAPSRSSIITGRHHWQNEQSGQHAAPWLKKHVPFVDMLDQNGYVTGRTGKGVSPSGMRGMKMIHYGERRTLPGLPIATFVMNRELKAMKGRHLVSVR